MFSTLNRDYLFYRLVISSEGPTAGKIEENFF